MPAPLVTAVIIAALGYIVWASLERAFVAYLAVLILLPAALSLPNGLVSVLTVHRVAVLALGLRAVIALRRREISIDALRPTTVHAIFFVFVAVALVNGVLLAAPQTSTTEAVNTWLGVVDQFLAFAVAVVVLRTLPNTRAIARAFAVLVGISAVIAICERITGTSWARLVLKNMPGQSHVLNAIPLEQRGGGARVRAAAEFGLQFGWISTIALPIVAVVAIRARHWALRLAPFALVLAIYWANSRSTVPGIAVVIAIVALFGGSRRATVLGLAALAVGALLWFGVSAVNAPFHGTRQTASSQIRSKRLPEIVDILRERPYQGLGFNGTDPYGFPTTDSSYLLVYSELGVVGAASFAALVIVLVAFSVRGLVRPPPWERLLAAAAVAGIVAGLMGGLAFDMFSLAGSANLFWVIAAIAVVLAERDPTRLPRARWSSRRLAGPVLGVVVGVTLAVAVPSHADVVTPFDALPLRILVNARGNQGYAGQFWRNTVCGTAKAVPLPAGVNLECHDRFQEPGFGQLRVDAPSLAKARAGMATVRTALEDHVHGIRFHPSSEEHGRPTWARTAPVWLGLGAFLISMFCPVGVRAEEDEDERLARHEALALDV
jgi:hypothetical protein